jgi:predicted dehydrogenase
MIRWGIIGCGDVTEVKSGPGFQKAEGSALVAVTRRDRARAEDYARRHGVPKVHATADTLIADPDVDAVYIATPPSTHYDLALRTAAARKPCLVEKPMAMNHGECVRMVEAFRSAGTPLWVAYYRRALPRFLRIRQLIAEGAVGRVTSVRIELLERLARGDLAATWRCDPAVAGAGLFYDLGSHALDLVDFLLAPITEVHGVALNTGGTYSAEDLTAAVFRIGSDVSGTGLWNFNAFEKRDVMVVTGTDGELSTAVFGDTDVVARRSGDETAHLVRNPPHVHQPLIQSIVDELLGRGRCESTGVTAARTSWVLERCVARYYNRQSPLVDGQTADGE